jgi:hypothetical protein
VNGPPESDGEESKGHIDESNDSKDGGKIRTPVFIHYAPEHEISDINKPEYEGCCKPGIPCPPNIPDRPRPYGACYQDKGAEDDPDLDRTIGDDVPFEISFVEIKDTGQEGDEKRKKSQKGGRNMDIKNLLDNPHGFFNGSVKKYGIEGREHDHKGQVLVNCEDGPFKGHCYSSKMNSKVK